MNKCKAQLRCSDVLFCVNHRNRKTTALRLEPTAVRAAHKDDRASHWSAS